MQKDHKNATKVNDYWDRDSDGYKTYEFICGTVIRTQRISTMELRSLYDEEDFPVDFDIALQYSLEWSLVKAESDETGDWICFNEAILGIPIPPKEL